MSLLNLPPITDKWTQETYEALSTVEMERLQVILDHKLYELETMFEHRLFSSSLEGRRRMNRKNKTDNNNIKKIIK